MACNSLGRVIQGAHSGYYVFRAAQFGIKPDAFYLLPDKDATTLGPDAVRLDLDSVVGYEEISSQKGPNTNAVIKSTVLGGVGLGLLASSVSSSESAVFALLLKSGETCTIEIEHTGSVQFFRQSFFTKKGVPSNRAGSGASMARVNGNPDTLLERAFMFLEDGDWSSAEIYCESVLDQDPKCARAYLGKLMAELRVHMQEELVNCEMPFDGSDNYRKAIRFGDESLQQMLTSAVDSIFHELNNFKESVQNLNKISFLSLKKSLGDIKVGDYIIIGQYDSKNIEWLALEKTDGRVLLISKDSVSQCMFGLYDSDTWEDCMLRQWLNLNFRDAAFSENVKKLILKTEIDIEDETQNTEENHRTISDKIFLLSVTEVEKYFSSVESRQCGYSWWLRSPNRKSGRFA